jgi:hypothetical protein
MMPAKPDRNPCASKSRCLPGGHAVLLADGRTRAVTRQP